MNEDSDLVIVSVTIGQVGILLFFRVDAKGTKTTETNTETATQPPK